MANNINLKAGSGITCSLDTSKDTLTIQIADADLKDITTIKNILERLEAIESAITLKAQWEEVSPKPTKVTNELSKAWVQNIIGDTAPKDHNHDNRYYTETEINSKLANKSDTGHTHTIANNDITDLKLGGTENAAANYKVHIRY